MHSQSSCTEFDQHAIAAATLLPHKPEPAWLGRLPVMPATVLALELVLQEPCIDLDAVSRIVLCDVGATIHLFRQMDREDLPCATHLSRIQNCLAVIDLEDWCALVSSRAIISHPNHGALMEKWRRSHLIAQYAQSIAELLEDVSGETAYLIGLLSETTAIARLLGLEEIRSPGELLQSIEGVPRYLCDALKEEASAPAVFWKAILRLAHQLAATPGVSDSQLRLAAPDQIRTRLLSEMSRHCACCSSAEW